MSYTVCKCLTWKIRLKWAVIEIRDTSKKIVYMLLHITKMAWFLLKQYELNCNTLICCVLLKISFKLTIARSYKLERQKKKKFKTTSTFKFTMRVFSRAESTFSGKHELKTITFLIISLSPQEYNTWSLKTIESFTSVTNHQDNSHK